MPILDTLKSLAQIPRAIVARLWRPKQEMKVPEHLAVSADRVSMIEKILARVEALGGKAQFLPIQDSYTGETEEMRQAYRVMWREPHVKASLLTKILAVAALDIQSLPGGDREIDKDASEFVKFALQKAKGGTRSIVTSILMGGLVEGYSVCEKVNKLHRNGRWAGKMGLAQLKAKDTNDIELLGDQFKNVTAIRDRRTRDEFHPSNFVLFKHLSLYESPTGMSDLRAAYRAYWLKNTAWQLRAIGLERWGLPIIKGVYPAGGASDDVRAELEAKLPLLRAQSWMTLPDNAKLEALDIAARGQSDFESAIRQLDEEIVIGITGAVLQMLQGQVADGRGSSSVHKGTAELLQWYLAAEIGDIISDQIVPDLVDFNFTGAEYPTITFGGVNDTAMVSSLQIDEGLQRMGMDLSRDELYTKYGRQKPADDEDKLPPPMSQNVGPLGLAAGGMLPTQFDEEGQPVQGQGQEDPRAAIDKSSAIAELQKAYFAGEMVRDAAIANAVTLLGVEQTQAQALFPMVNEEEVQQFDDAAGGVQLFDDDHGEVEDFAVRPFKTRRGTTGVVADNGRRYYGATAQKMLNAAKVVSPKQPVSLPSKQPAANETPHPYKTLDAPKVTMPVVDRKKVDVAVVVKDNDIDGLRKETVHGQKLTLPGFEQYSFALVPPEGRGKKGWMVHETNTGLSLLPKNNHLRGEAVQAAVALLARRGNKLDEVIELGLKKQGKAPPASPKPPQAAPPPSAAPVAVSGQWVRENSPATSSIQSRASAILGRPVSDVIPLGLSRLQKMPQAPPASSPPAKRIYAEAELLDIPDVRQVNDWDCGPASVRAVDAFHFGLGDPLESYVTELGTTPEAGTAPSKVVQFFLDRDCAVNDESMSPGELEFYTRAGWPVLCLVTKNGIGHWVVVRGCDEQTVYLHDPEEGRLEIPVRDFEESWHDTDADGTTYSHYGVAVGEPGDDEEPDDEPDEPHKYSSTQFTLGEPHCAAVKQLAGKIPDDAIAADGRETAPHLTVKYGLHTDSHASIARLVGNFGPVVVKLGKTSCFPGDQHDVVKVDVTGDDLFSLNRLVGALNHTDTHPDYVPHITLAYVKPGEGKKYVGLSDLDGTEVALSELTFSNRAGEKTVVHLGKGIEQFDDEQPKTDTEQQDVAGAGSQADADKVQLLLNASEKEGARVLAEITKSAITRLVNAGVDPATAPRLFDDDETKLLADALAKTIGTANLMGRVRVHRVKDRFDKLEADGVEKFSDDEPSFATFADEPLKPMVPQRALDFFQSLAPSLRLDPAAFDSSIRRTAFNMAATTDMQVLDRVKKVIETGLRVGIPGSDWLGGGRSAERAIKRILDRAGVTVRNPQYPEMVFRTNTMSAYNQGTTDEMRQPEMKEFIPAWEYVGIRDGRQRPEHEAHFGTLFPNAVTFAEVRDSLKLSPWNCRCVMKLMHKYALRRALAGGKKVVEWPSYLAEARAKMRAGQ